MEEWEKESIKTASEEISTEVKTLIDSHDLDSLKQLQLLMYFSSTPFSFMSFNFIYLFIVLPGMCLKAGTFFVFLDEFLGAVRSP